MLNWRRRIENSIIGYRRYRVTWRVREGGESVKNEVITSTPCLYLYSSLFLYQIVCCICTVSVCINWGPL